MLILNSETHLLLPLECWIEGMCHRLPADNQFLTFAPGLLSTVEPSLGLPSTAGDPLQSSHSLPSSCLRRGQISNHLRAWGTFGWTDSQLDEWICGKELKCWKDSFIYGRLGRQKVGNRTATRQTWKTPAQIPWPVSSHQSCVCWNVISSRKASPF